MALTNITATASNGAQVIAAQTKTARQVCSAVDEGLIFTGALSANNTTASITLDNCSILVGDVDNWITYTDSTNTNAQTNGTIVLRDSRVEWKVGTVKRTARFTNILGSHIRATKGTGGLPFVYTQGGNKANIDQLNGRPTVFDGIHCHELTGQPAVYQNAVYVNCGLNILNRDAVVLNVRDIVFNSGTYAGTAYTGADGQSYTTYDAWIGNSRNNVINFYDCTINMSKICIDRTSSLAGDEQARKYFSRTEKYMVGTLPEAGIKARFTPTASTGTSLQAGFDLTTNSNGFLQNSSLVETRKIDLLIQTTLDTGGTVRTTGMTEPVNARPYTLKNVTWIRRAIDYNIFGVEADVTPASKVGDINNPSFIYFQSVPYLTLTESQASALTGISIIASGANAGTVTVSANTTVSNLWHYWRWWISQWSAYPSGTNDTWTYDGSTLNIGGWSLVVNTGVTLTGNITTSATITRNGTAVVDGSFSDSSGSTYKFTINGIVTDSEVRCYTGTNPATSVEIAGTESSSGDFAFYQKSSGQSGYIQIHHVDYQMVRIPIIWPSSATSLPVQQIKDRQYNRGTVYVPS